jgi:DNA-binding transcriptional LysR family regulator
MIWFILDMNIRNLDLNLLVLFDALAEEGNLTRAAAKVGLSQPAMSNALARLRAQLDDVLFVRSPRGLEPTKRARTLIGPIRAALRDVERVLTTETFDPRTTRRTFTVMMNDIHELVLGPVLSSRIAAEAPHAHLRLVQGPATTPDEALATEVDIVISPLENATVRAQRAALYQLDFSALVRGKHSRIRRSPTLKQYLELEHVLVAPRGLPGSVVDEIFAKKGLHRHVARVVAHFVSAVFLVCRSDYIVTLPTVLARSMAASLPVRVLKLPLDLPSVAMGQFWSARNESDRGHQWLRGLLTEAGRAVQLHAGVSNVPVR